MINVYAIIWDNHEAYEDWNTSVLGYVTNEEHFEKWKIEERRKSIEHYGDDGEWIEKNYSLKLLLCYDENFEGIPLSGPKIMNKLHIDMSEEEIDYIINYFNESFRL